MSLITPNGRPLLHASFPSRQNKIPDSLASKYHRLFPGILLRSVVTKGEMEKAATQVPQAPRATPAYYVTINITRETLSNKQVRKV